MTERTILIVDDEPHVIRVLRLMLAKEGYTILSANDGNEALALLASSRPDVMISDIQMEGMNGRDLCHATRARYPDEPFLILVMTSMTAAEERSWVKNLDNIEFLEKPLSPRQLAARLATYFSAMSALPEMRHAS